MQIILIRELSALKGRSVQVDYEVEIDDLS